MTKEGKKVGFRLGEKELTFFESKEYPAGDTYVLFLNEILKGSGMHLSFHRSGEVHFKITKPVKLTVKVKIEDLELLSKDILKAVLREPADYFECIISFPDTIDDLALPTSGSMINFLEISKRMRYVKTDSKGLLKTLAGLVNSGKVVKNKDFITITTDSNELILYKPLSEENLKKLSDNPIMSDKFELFSKYGGLILTGTTSKENNPLIKIFEKHFPDLKNLFDSIKELVNLNADAIETDFQNLLKLASESIEVNQSEIKGKNEDT